MKNRAHLAMGVALLVGLMLAAPAVFATDLAASATPNKISVGGSTTINIIYPSGVDTESALWVAVLTPSGAIWVLGGANAPTPVATFTGTGSASPVTSCGVPYGVAGSLSVSNVGGTASVSGCSGSNTWYLASASGLSGWVGTVEPDCKSTGSTNPSVTATTGSGDTSSAGTYSVIICYSYGPSTSISFTSADTNFSTPEFGLGLGVVLAVALMGVLLVRKRSLGSLKTPAL
jgi:hypothetical protein